MGEYGHGTMRLTRLAPTKQRVTKLHVVRRILQEAVTYPAHPPGTESAEYRQVHHHLIYELDEPCWICGVRRSTLNDPAQNPCKATQMETHHDGLEWALANAVDPAKIYADFKDKGMAAPTDAALRAWLDSEGAMTVLCDVHHRKRFRGIHVITYPVWAPQRWVLSGFPYIPADTNAA